MIIDLRSTEVPCQAPLLAHESGSVEVPCSRRQISAAACRGAQCAAATGGPFNAPAAPDAFSRAARALGVRGQEAVGPVLFDLATQIKAVGETALAAPISNPGTLPSKISITY